MTKEFNLLFEQELMDVFCIEIESKTLIPKLQNFVDDQNLLETLDAQFTTSNSNIAKLKNICKTVGVDNPEKASDCIVLTSLVNRVDNYLSEGPVCDAGILSHIERINNYKIAIYNSATRFAKELDNLNIHKELQSMSNYTYNIMDRFARLNDDQSDERAIQKL